jgi:hypothetical protein
MQDLAISGNSDFKILSGRMPLDPRVCFCSAGLYTKMCSDKKFLKLGMLRSLFLQAYF